MTLSLGDVTLCAVDSVNVGLAARALRISMGHCEFAEAIHFSHVPVPGPFRCVLIDRIASTTEYSRFVFKRLPDYVHTPYALIVQWDGYVVDPSAWRPAFREYDYIGAKWPHVTDGMAVGNGGFSLCSQRFMRAMTEARFPLDEAVASDWLVCRTYRPALERDFGVRFAPVEVADGFSYETGKPTQPTFGFHGMGHIVRHTGDGEMLEVIKAVDPYVLPTAHCVFLLMTCAELERHVPLRALYRRMKDHLGGELMFERLKAIAGDDRIALRLAALGESLLATPDAARVVVVP